MPPLTDKPTTKLLRVDLNALLSLNDKIPRSVTNFNGHEFPSGIVRVTRRSDSAEGVGATNIELELSAVEERGGDGGVGEDGVGEAGTCMVCFYYMEF